MTCLYNQTPRRLCLKYHMQNKHFRVITVNTHWSPAELETPIKKAFKIINYKIFFSIHGGIYKRWCLSSFFISFSSPFYITILNNPRKLNLWLFLLKKKCKINFLHLLEEFHFNERLRIISRRQINFQVYCYKLLTHSFALL